MKCRPRQRGREYTLIEAAQLLGLSRFEMLGLLGRLLEPTPVSCEITIRSAELFALRVLKEAIPTVR